MLPGGSHVREVQQVAPVGFAPRQPTVVPGELIPGSWGERTPVVAVTVSQASARFGRPLWSVLADQSAAPTAIHHTASGLSRF